MGAEPTKASPRTGCKDCSELAQINKTLVTKLINTTEDANQYRAEYEKIQEEGRSLYNAYVTKSQKAKDQAARIASLETLLQAAQAELAAAAGRSEAETGRAAALAGRCQELTAELQELQDKLTLAEASGSLPATVPESSRPAAETVTIGLQTEWDSGRLAKLEAALEAATARLETNNANHRSAIAVLNEKHAREIGCLQTEMNRELEATMELWTDEKTKWAAQLGLVKSKLREASDIAVQSLDLRMALQASEGQVRELSAAMEAVQAEAAAAAGSAQASKAMSEELEAVRAELARAEDTAAVRESELTTLQTLLETLREAESASSDRLAAAEASLATAKAEAQALRQEAAAAAAGADNARAAAAEAAAAAEQAQAAEATAKASVEGSQAALARLQSELDDAVARESELQSRLAASQEKTAAAKSAANAVRTEHQAEMRKLAELLEEARVVAEDASAARDAAVKRNQEMTRIVKKFEIERSAESESIRSKTTEVAGLKGQITTLKVQLTDVQSKLDVSEREGKTALAQARFRIAALTSEAETAAAEAAAVKTATAELKAALAEAKAAAAVAEKQASEIQSKLDDVTVEAAQSKASMERLAVELQRADGDCDALRKHVRALEAHTNELEAQILEHGSALAAIKGAADGLESEKAILLTQLETLLAAVESEAGPEPAQLMAEKLDLQRALTSLKLRSSVAGSETERLAKEKSALMAKYSADTKKLTKALHESEDLCASMQGEVNALEDLLATTRVTIAAYKPQLSRIAPAIIEILDAEA